MNERDHLADAADLYAIGALEESERAAIDGHVRNCSDCARLLADAEDRVAALVEADARHAPPPQLERRIASVVRRPPLRRQPLIAAIAAAFVIGLLPTAYFWRQNQAMHAAMAVDAEALSRVASMPHRSVAFSGTTGAPAARVMYAADGSWYVIFVRGASRALSVAWMHDGERTVLGTVTPRGQVAVLFLPKSHRMNQLALMDGEQVVAEAQLAY